MGTPNILITQDVLYHKTSDQQWDLTHKGNIKDPSLQFKSTHPVLSYACDPTMIAPEMEENENKQVCIGKICGLCLREPMYCNPIMD
jgi:hypothetical protein